MTTTRPFEALVAVEGRWTGDERLLMVDGLTWEGMLPFPLTINHGDVRDVVGRIDKLERMPGASDDERFIFGKGVIDLGSELGQETARLIDGKFLKGVSIEPEAIKEGGVDPEDPKLADMSWPLVVESSRLGGASVVVHPAFPEAFITFEALSTSGLPPAIDGPTPLPADEVPEVDMPEDAIIVAAAGHTITIPRVPPAEWFEEPVDVEIMGALTVTDEGRVYGLLAPAGVPFLGDPSIPGVPMGNVDYSRFLRGEAFVQGGRHVAGNVTMGCGHAKGSTVASALEHHENTCSVVAQVNVGECAQGVWVAGALLASATPDQVQRMMACQLSGEWYPRSSGGYELINALLVPVPAFALARKAPYTVTRGGKLAASAIPVEFEDCGCGGHSDEEMRVRLEAVEREVELARLRRTVDTARRHPTPA